MGRRAFLQFRVSYTWVDRQHGSWPGSPLVEVNQATLAWSPPEEIQATVAWSLVEVNQATVAWSLVEVNQAILARLPRLSNAGKSSEKFNIFISFLNFENEHLHFELNILSVFDCNFPS